MVIGVIIQAMTVAIQLWWYILKLVHTVVIVVTYIQKEIHWSQLREFHYKYMGLLQHVSVQTDHVQVIHVSRSSRNSRWIMDDLYMNEISLYK